MTKALLGGPGKRVMAAVEGGALCRQGAARLGVSASSAIRWHALLRTGGDALPRRQGGDRRLGRIKAHAALILGALGKKPDIALADPRAALAGPGIGAGGAGLWRA